MMELLRQARNVGLCYNWLFWGNHASLSKILDMMSGLTQKDEKFYLQSDQMYTRLQENPEIKYWTNRVNSCPHWCNSFSQNKSILSDLISSYHPVEVPSIR